MKTIATCMTAVGVAAWVGLAGPASATVPQAGRIGSALTMASSAALGGGSSALAPQAQDADGCGVGMPPTSVTEAEQEQMVDLHNALRAKYNVPALTWDDTLAACAQDWTNEREKTNDNPVHRPGDQFGATRYGENTYTAKWSDPNHVSLTPQGAMDNLWGKGEEANFDPDTGKCKPGTVCGHFTQSVWSTTTKIGCGKVTVPDPPYTMVRWTCNYYPAGNDGGSPFTGASPAPQDGGSSPGPQNNDPPPLDSDNDSGQ